MKTVLFLSFLLFTQFVNAQEKSPAELKEIFNDAEFFFVQEQYQDALYDYSQIYNSGYKDNANINYRIGICYLNIPGQKEKAINFLLQAVTKVAKKYNESNIKQLTAPFDAYLYLGNAYRVNNKLSDAINSYNKYKEIVGSSEEIKYADQQIAACNTASRFMNTPLQVKLTNLGDSINGTSSNFKGVISGNGSTILYMNELPFYDAVYFARYTEHGWSSPINITPQIQSDGDQYVTSVSYDGTQLFLTREDAFNSDIYVSNFNNGTWSKSVPVEGQDINTKYWESHASISRDGKTLYFASNRKDGVGEMDLYVTKIQPGGHWGTPENLGPGINTPLNEDTPFITENDSVLYFSSQGHENMGGYDIFFVKTDASGTLGKPENIRYPINTTDDDLFFYPWNNARAAVMSRIMENGYGKEDLYAIQQNDDNDFKDILANLLKADEKPTGTVLASVVPANTQVTEEVEQIEPVRPGAEVNPIETKEIPDAPVTARPVEGTAKPLPAPKEIELEPVYFAFDNFLLDETAKKQLEQVYQFLRDFPTAHVRLIGHADARGPAEYNLKLSEKRAVTTRDYIINKGIDPGRLEITGMGEKNFAAINNNDDGTDNPEGRRLNRRVEYELIGPDNALLFIRMSSIPERLKFRK